MRSAQECLADLAAIIREYGSPDGVTLTFTYDSITEARQHLINIRHMQKRFRLLKKEVTQSMKEIRSAYTAQKSQVQAGFLSSLAGRKAAGHNRAAKKEQLRQQQEAILSPYQQVSDGIDKALVILDSVKLKLDTWVVENK